MLPISVFIFPKPAYVGNVGLVPLYVDVSAIVLLFIVMIGEELMVLKMTLLAVLVLAIVLHELGHAVMARMTGAQGVRIYITGLGGLCTYEPSFHLSDRQKMQISLAGPAVNIVLATIAAILIYTVPFFGQERYQVQDAELILWYFVHKTFLLNVFLAAFNLLPLFPMDGGQAFLAGLRLSGKSDYRSRKITFIVSIIAGIVGIGIFGYYQGEPSPFMMVIVLLLLSEAYRHLNQ